MFLQKDKIITWHARRFANGVERKIDSEANDTAGHEFTIMLNSRSAQVYELNPFWKEHSSQLREGSDQ